MSQPDTASAVRSEDASHGDTPSERAPFVTPTVTELGGLTGLTQLGGTL